MFYLGEYEEEAAKEIRSYLEDAGLKVETKPCLVMEEETTYTLNDKGKIELIAALTEIIKHDEDRIMIVDLGPLDGRAEDRIEFLGVHPSQTESEAVVV